MDVRTGPGQHFVFTLETDENVSPGTLAFSLPQRKWATLSLNQEIDVTPYQFSPDKHYLSSIVLEVDFFNKKNTSTDPFNSDDMAKEFSMQFCKQVLLGGKHWAWLITFCSLYPLRPSRLGCRQSSTSRTRSCSQWLSRFVKHCSL